MASMPPGLGASPPPTAAPGGTGAAMSPSPMQGNQAQGMAALKTAVEALTKALPQLPMGSEIHATALKSLTSLSKHMDGVDPQPTHGDMVQQLAAMARQSQQGGGQNPLAAMMPGGGAQAPAPDGVQ
jgi:hypothetical protein